ncbi:MAG: hypothetical protein ACREMP_04830 [Candidatus Tyrphobacter sp.]
MILSGAAYAQSAAVTFLADRDVSTDMPREPHAEQMVVVDPRDPKDMVATCFVIEGARLDDVVYSTKDGGETWKRAQRLGAGRRDRSAYVEDHRERAEPCNRCEDRWI